MNEADQGGAEGCMSKIEGFNQKDLKKPPVYDMEAGNFPQVQKVDTALSQSTIDDLQDDLKMTHAVKKVSESRFVHQHPGPHERQNQK